MLAVIATHSGKELKKHVIQRIKFILSCHFFPVLYFFLRFIFIAVCVCGNLRHICWKCSQVPEEAPDTREQELNVVVVSHPPWVLGADPASSGRAADALTAGLSLLSPPECFCAMVTLLE